MGQRLWIPGPMPGLNEVLEARMTLSQVIGVGHKGKRWNKYSDLKREWSHRILIQVRAQRTVKVGPCYFTYVLLEPSRKRDPDNVAGGAQKLIKDGLKHAGIVDGDGWKHVLGFKHHWDVSRKCPGVCVFLSEDSCVEDKDTAIRQAMGYVERTVTKGKVSDR